MGHDIYARSSRGSEEGALDNVVDVAYLRRSAFSPLNKLIYDALGAESAYGGVSGTGEMIEFSKAQIEQALIGLPGTPIDREAVEKGAEDFRKLRDLLAREGATEVILGGEEDSEADIRPELEFLRTILMWMEVTGSASVFIRFA